MVTFLRWKSATTREDEKEEYDDYRSCVKRIGEKGNEKERRK